MSAFFILNNGANPSVFGGFMAAVRGADVNFACIGPGVDATHHYERTHIDALANNAALLLAYLTDEE